MNSAKLLTIEGKGRRKQQCYHERVKGLRRTLEKLGGGNSAYEAIQRGCAAVQPGTLVAETYAAVKVSPFVWRDITREAPAADQSSLPEYSTINLCAFWLDMFLALARIYAIIVWSYR